METIPLEQLELVIFDKNQKEHVEFLKSLIKDKTILSRFQGLTNNLLHNYGDPFFDRSFFVAHNKRLIGFVNIGAINEREKSVYLRYAIEATSRGLGYGTELLKEVTTYIFMNHEEIETVRLKIANDNKASLKAASKSGFVWLRDDFYAAYNRSLDENYKPKM